MLPFKAPCSPSGSYTGILSTKKDVAVDLSPDLSYAASTQLPPSDTGTWTANLRMQFDTDGSISGSFSILIALADGKSCNTGELGFSGKLQPPS